MDFQTIRLYGSIAIILGCFCFIYPKLLHPLVMAGLGMGGTPEKKVEDNFVPPPLRDRHPHLTQKAQEMHEQTKSFRQGPHPGMRAASAEQTRQSGKGSGRGMMGIILPMYAIGIVIYLVYTLFKVFNKKEEKSRQSPSRSPERRPLDLSAEDSFDEGRVRASVDKPLSQDELSKHLHELHEMADRVQENDNNVDMRKLQQRLAETEAQMSKILAAMQAVQMKVGSAEKVTGQTPGTASTSGSSPSSQQGQTTLEEVGGETKAAKSGIEGQDEASQDNTSNNEGDTSSNIQGKGEEDSSPEPSNLSEGSSHESESYEIITSSERDSSPVEVETLSSLTEEQGKGDNPVEVEEVILKDRKEDDEDVVTSVRKRVPRTED